jgi:hypothetical protein
VECTYWPDLPGGGGDFWLFQAGYATSFFGDSSQGQYLYVHCGIEDNDPKMTNQGVPFKTKDVAFYYDNMNVRHDLATGFGTWTP